MSGVHFIIVENKRFKDIPKCEFYFDNLENLIESLERLEYYDFNVNLFLDLDSLSESDLEDILSINNKYKKVFLDKEAKIKYYKDNIEDLIL